MVENKRIAKLLCDKAKKRTKQKHKVYGWDILEDSSITVSNKVFSRTICNQFELANTF